MSLIAWYKLDGNADDSMGLLAGTANNITWEAGKIEQCGNFNGVNSRVSMGIGSDLFPKPNLSLSVWFKSYGITATTSTLPGIFGLTYGIKLFVLENRTYFSWDDGTTTNSIIATTNFHNDGKWHHAVATLSPTEVKFYIDGTLIGTNSTNHWLGTTRWPTNSLNLGRDNNNANYYFTGLIDDFKIYDHALSQKEVKELSKAKVLHYKFNDFQEPTTNVVTNTNLDTGWSKNYCTGILWNDIDPPEGINSPVVSFYDADTTQSAYWYSYGDYAPQVPNTTYTVSLYVKTNDSNFRIRFYTADNAEVGRYTSEFITVPNDGQWHRVVWNSFLNAADSASDSLSFYFAFGNLQGETQRTWFCAPQMEAKDHVTPFVVGTRTGEISDCSGYDNNSTLALTTTPQWITDSKLGSGCFEFNGNDSYIELSQPIPQIGNSSLTLSMWCYFNDDSRGILFGDYTRPNATGINFEKHINRRLRLYWSANPDIFTPDNVVPLNEFCHVIFVIDRENNQVRFYVGSQLVHTYNGTLTEYNVNSLFLLGRDNRTGTTTLNGKIDDVRIYATALSDDDILELYQTRASLDNNGNLYTHEINETKHHPLILDYTQWQDGQTGSVGMFTRNGSNGENFRILGSDPWGKETVLWEARPDEISGPDGGWASSYFDIDNSKTHRISTWIRRTVIGNGSTYLGTNGSPTAVLNLSNGIANSNPYFWSGGVGTTEWILYVGHVHPVGYTGPVHPDTGRYSATGTKLGSANDFVCQSGTTSLRHRSYLYYSIDTSTRQQWVYPRFDICDGNEPSIADLLAGHDSRNIDMIRTIGGTSQINLKVTDNLTHISTISELGPTEGLVAYYPLNGDTNDYSGNNNHGVNNGATVTSGINNKSAYLFDGTGTNDGVIEGSNIALNGAITSTANYPNGCTYSFWLNVDTDADNRLSLFFGNTTINHIEIYSSSRYFRTEAAIQNEYTFGSGVFPDAVRGIWGHFSIVFANGETNRPVRWYQNGILFHTGSMDGGSYPGTEYFSFNNIGRSTGTTSYLYAKSFKGKIQDVRIYNRALSEQEIKILYQMTNPVTTKMKVDKYNLYLPSEINETL